MVPFHRWAIPAARGLIRVKIIEPWDQPLAGYAFRVHH
jgi:hypothetical protein